MGEENGGYAHQGYGYGVLARYVCVNVCAYEFVRVWMCVCVFICECVCTCICILRMCIFEYIAYSCMHVFVHTFLSTSIHMHTYIHGVFWHTYRCIHGVFLHRYTYIHGVFLHTYTYMHCVFLHTLHIPAYVPT